MATCQRVSDRGFATTACCGPSYLDILFSVFRAMDREGRIAAGIPILAADARNRREAGSSTRSRSKSSPSRRGYTNGWWQRIVVSAGTTTGAITPNDGYPRNRIVTD